MGTVGPKKKKIQSENRWVTSSYGLETLLAGRRTRPKATPGGGRDLAGERRFPMRLQWGG